MDSKYHTRRLRLHKVSHSKGKIQGFIIHSGSKIDLSRTIARSFLKSQNSLRVGLKVEKIILHQFTQKSSCRDVHTEPQHIYNQDPLSSRRAQNRIHTELSSKHIQSMLCMFMDRLLIKITVCLDQNRKRKFQAVASVPPHCSAGSKGTVG